MFLKLSAVALATSELSSRSGVDGRKVRAQYASHYNQIGVMPQLPNPTAEQYRECRRLLMQPPGTQFTLEQRDLLVNYWQWHNQNPQNSAHFQNAYWPCPPSPRLVRQVGAGSPTSSQQMNHGYAPLNKADEEWAENLMRQLQPIQVSGSPSPSNSRASSPGVISPAPSPSTVSPSSVAAAGDPFTFGSFTPKNVVTDQTQLSNLQDWLAQTRGTKEAEARAEEARRAEEEARRAEEERKRAEQAAQKANRVIENLERSGFCAPSAILAHPRSASPLGADEIVRATMTSTPQLDDDLGRTRLLEQETQQLEQKRRARQQSHSLRGKSRQQHGTPQNGDRTRPAQQERTWERAQKVGTNPRSSAFQ